MRASLIAIRVNQVEKRRSLFEFAYMSKSLLKGLLHDILGVFSRTCDASRNKENPSLVTFDENFKCLQIPGLRSSDEGSVTLVGKPVNRGNRRFFFVHDVCESGFHSVAPSWFRSLLLLRFSCSSTCLM